MYRLGTLRQFTLEDNKLKRASGWTDEEVKNGKIETYEGDGEVIETMITNILLKRQNPNGSDEYLWESSNGDIKDPFNIICSWKKRIKGHDSTKYYVALKSICSLSDSEEKDCYIYGELEVGRVIGFGSKVTDVEIFDTEQDYLARCEKLAIEIENYGI